MVILPTGKENYEDFLRRFNFSFSSVNSFHNCKRCFWLTYLQKPKLDREENAFAQWGTFMHSLYERFYRGQLDFFDVCEEYDSKYNNQITLAFPKNRWVDLGKKYYESGLKALESFVDLPENIELVGTEIKVQLKIDGIAFVGFIDMVLRNKDTQNLIVVDHKSKSKFTSKQEQKEYARQLYLYSLAVKEKFGTYPSKLVFNMFRAGQIVEIDFSESDLQEAIDWFTETVGQIFLETSWQDKIATEYKNKDLKLAAFKKQDFFCNELCSMRKYCQRSKDFKKDG